MKEKDIVVNAERESGLRTVSVTASQRKMTVFLTHLAGMLIDRKDNVSFAIIFQAR